jgi:hypothetical protein
MGRLPKFRIRALGVAAAGLLCAAQAIAAVGPLDPREAIASLSDATTKTINENDLYCLTLAVYFEGGSTGETEEGQRHIARVVHLRAQANRRVWGGSDICDVVFYNRRGVCQFTFACLPLARRSPRGGAAWRYSQEIAEDELAGRSNVHAVFIRYYMNPSLTPAKNACRFRREFVPVLIAGRHHFFREPLARERAEIAKGEYAECSRQAKTQSRKSAKAAAKPAPKKPPSRVATNP